MNNNNKAVRTTMSIRPSVKAKAEQIMALRDISDFSSLVDQLIREEHERRGLPLPPNVILSHAVQKPKARLATRKRS